MGPYIGKPNRLYKVFRDTRPLNLQMLRNLNAGLSTSAEVLIQPTGEAALVAEAWIWRLERKPLKPPPGPYSP